MVLEELSFIKGDSLERKGANEILKRTFDEGNAIAHHSYTHDYKNYILAEA